MRVFDGILKRLGYLRCPKCGKLLNDRNPYYCPFDGTRLLRSGVVVIDHE